MSPLLPAAPPRVVRGRLPAAARPRTVLAAVVALIVVTTALYAVAPWILPVRIREGPMVQLAGPTSADLVWYTTRPAKCSVRLADAAAGVSVSTNGNRHVARLSNLAAGREYPYTILVGQRALTDGLAMQTNRETGQQYTFIVFGDSGRGSRAQYRLATDMARAVPPADFVLHTGDVVYPSGERRLYEERFFAPYRHLLPRIGFWPSLGNHDVSKDPAVMSAGGLAYQEVFELPGNGPPGLPADANYWFEYASCRVAIIDTNLEEAVMRDRVAPWLQKVMAAPGVAWRFVVGHHPAYTAGRYAPDLRIQRTLVPVFDATGVDAVFAGHDHNYQRMLPLRDGQPVDSGGVLYIVTGAGGAELYQLKPPDQRPAYLAASDDREHSFTHVTVSGSELHLRQIAVGGRVVDDYTRHKPSPPPAKPTETQPATAPALPPQTAPTP